MKQLLVDVGNTRIKWSLLDQGTIQARDQFVWQENLLTEVLDQQWLDLGQADEVLVSNVAGEKVEEVLAAWCKSRWNKVITFAKVVKSQAGVTNSYAEIERLGVDRWLAMLAAWDMLKDKVCIIDCGSAITLDVLDEQGMHQGGMIAPGLALSSRALTDHTHALEAENRSGFSLLASNTEDAMNTGCYHLFIGGVRYMIERVQQQYGKDIAFVITGGDAEKLTLVLRIELRYEPDLILHGLGLSKK